MKRLAVGFIAALLASSAIAGTGSSSLGSPASKTVVETTSGTEIVPTWATRACVEMVGGGGGGSGGWTSSDQGGGGGGGGNYTFQCAPVTGGATLTTTVGAAGTGGAVLSNGVGGGFSAISGFANGIALIAYGGAPGTISAGTAAAGVGGQSTAGSANPTAGANIVTLYGQDGTVPAASASFLRCYTQATGTVLGTGGTAGGGAGGCSYLGVGGAGGNENPAGTGAVGGNGTGYGAGGGGGGRGSVAGGAGGNGSPGIIMITYTP